MTVLVVGAIDQQTAHAGRALFAEGYFLKDHHRVLIGLYCWAITGLANAIVSATNSVRDRPTRSISGSKVPWSKTSRRNCWKKSPGILFVVGVFIIRPLCQHLRRNFYVPPGLMQLHERMLDLLAE